VTDRRAAAAGGRGADRRRPGDASAGTWLGYVEPIDGKVHVVDDREGMSIADGAIVPGRWWEGVFPNNDCPCNSWILGRPEAYASLRIAVTVVGFADDSVWKAEGRPWAASAGDGRSAAKAQLN